MTAQQLGGLDVVESLGIGDSGDVLYDGGKSHSLRGNLRPMRMHNRSQKMPSSRYRAR